MRKTRSQVEEIINKYKEMLEKLGVNSGRAILYGSFAKGNPREDSDIDLIIVSEDFRRMNLRKRLEILGIAAARIMEPVEAKGYTPEEIGRFSRSSFLEEVLKVGISV